MAWELGTGTVAAANERTSDTSAPGGAITAPEGETIIVAWTFDNAGLTTPTISSIDKPGGETASWVKLGYHQSGSALGNGSLLTEVWGITLTTAWSAFAPTATLSSAVQSKAFHGRAWKGGTLTVRGTAPIQGNVSTAGAATKTLTGAEQPQVGDLVIGVGTKESATPPSADADTTDGSWDAGITSGTSGGTDASNVSLRYQYKIVTATGDQTFNPASAGDCGVVTFALKAAPNSGSASGSISWAGSATGTRQSAGSVSGAIDWAGSATGARPSQGSASGAISWVGSAEGSAPAEPPNEGSASGAIDWAGSATGARQSSGSAAGSIDWAGSATGARQSSGSVPGSISWFGSATGARQSSGSAAGAISWVGSATGARQSLGAASGSIDWAGSATGDAPADTGTSEGEAFGSISWVGSATGSRESKGSANGTVEWVGLAAGGRLSIGEALGGISWLGSATGRSAAFQPHPAWVTMVQNSPRITKVGASGTTTRVQGDQRVTKVPR